MWDVGDGKDDVAARCGCYWRSQHRGEECRLSDGRGREDGEARGRRRACFLGLAMGARVAADGGRARSERSADDQKLLEMASGESEDTVHRWATTSE